jgi:hypothetical protein
MFDQSSMFCWQHRSAFREDVSRADDHLVPDLRQLTG